MTAVDYDLMLAGARRAVGWVVARLPRPLPPWEHEDVCSALVERVWSAGLDERYEGPPTVDGWARYLKSNAYWAFADHRRAAQRQGVRLDESAHLAPWTTPHPTEPGDLIALRRAFNNLGELDRTVLEGRALGEQVRETGARVGLHSSNVSRRQRAAQAVLEGAIA